jgi:hypothetical protein
MHCQNSTLDPGKSDVPHTQIFSLIILCCSGAWANSRSRA